MTTQLYELTIKEYTPEQGTTDSPPVDVEKDKFAREKEGEMVYDVGLFRQPVSES